MDPHASALEEKRLVEQDIEAYLERYENKELLRFVAVGSVDDGKSTLIGRLLHDTECIYEDQLAAVRKASTGRVEEGLDFSLFTDGLKAEREQGITIDVAYRYFSTYKRKFIIADTPGHIQYTRNMVTGASTANVALILIDARLGVLQQSRRHATIARLLGIPHLAVCVNKMDLVGYDQAVYNRICGDFTEFSAKLDFKDVTYFPISALKGDNVANRSSAVPWFEGQTVLEYLESVPIASDRNLTDFRYPVQCVLRPNLHYRGFAGAIVSGTIRQGDEVLALPSGKRSRVRAIDCGDQELAEGFAPQSVTLRLTDEIDVSRGDMLVRPDQMPRVGRTFRASLVWASETPLDLDKTYLIKHTTQTVRVQVSELHSKLDMDSLEDRPADGLSLNDIGTATITCHRALYYDAYAKNRTTGAFVLVDSLTNNTVAAGMIQAEAESQDLDAAMRELRAGSGLAPKTQVSPRERMSALGQVGATVWLAGLPGSGRWALAYALERRLFDLGRTATVIDPTDEDLRSSTSAAKACTEAGLIAICAFPSYKEADRTLVRERVGTDRVVVVHVNTDEQLCRERRPNADFTGFEAPKHPDITVALDALRVEKAVEFIITELERRGQFRDQ